MIVAYLTEVRHRFAQDSKGVTAIEYGLIAALIAVVIISTVKLVGTDLVQVFGKVASSLVQTG
ncbi:MAG: Flp family type IVb pilin [Acetobacter sp.]|nr:Flp family type IVb pilin [Acetobacter sp.]